MRAESESFFESLFESPSKANTYGIAGTVTKVPQPSARLKVKVVPGSSRDGIVGWLGDALKIKVTAPPEKGRANEAVVSLLCERLGLPADVVTVVSGHSSPSMVRNVSMTLRHLRNEFTVAG